MHSFGWEPLPPEDYKKRTFQHLEDTMGYNVNVDTDKCVGCGECVDVCPVEVYEIKDGKSEPVNSEECLGCNPVWKSVKPAPSPLKKPKP